MSDFVEKANKKAEEFATEHPKQVNEGIEKAGEEVDKRTGDKYSKQVQEGVKYAEGHLPTQHRR